MAKHIHKYHKVKVNGVTVWACALPECNHHMPKHYEEMIPGKASICWDCANDMVMDETSLTEIQSICVSCRMKKEGIDTDGLLAHLASKGV